MANQVNSGGTVSGQFVHQGGYSERVTTLGVNVTAKDIDNDGVFDQASISGRTADGRAVSDSFDLRTQAGFDAFASVAATVGVEVTGDSQGNEILGLLNPSQQALFSSVSSEAKLLIAGGTSHSDIALQSQWASFVATGQFTEVDINALVQAVLRESYMESMQDLRFYAEKVSFYNGLKKDIRNELESLRKRLTDAVEAGVDDENNSLVAVGLDTTSRKFDGPLGIGEDGKPKVLESAPESITTKGELEDQIKALEERLNSVGDDAQLANVDLQNMLQKQQQTLQMMSNISKMLHDTAMSIIRKIGG